MAANMDNGWKFLVLTRRDNQLSCPRNEELSLPADRSTGKPISSHLTYFMKQKNVCEMWAWTALLAMFFGLVAPLIHAQEPSTNSSPVSSDPLARPAETESGLLSESYQDYVKGNLDAALNTVNKAIQLNSQDKKGFLLRALIYAGQKQWDKADSDYKVVLVNDPNNVIVKFDLADLKFMQKKYDEARSGFVQIQSDKDLGDFVTYKVFLCDLFGGHEDVAAKELEAFDQVGGNPSYYFANVAWDLVHNKTEDAAGWLKSAKYIYADSPQKFERYASSLTSLGLLPLHLSSAQ
jgi:Tfp pilus assembly protein PilF